MTDKTNEASIERVTAGDRRLRERYGPWAVVTGASDGIGRELARRVAAAGISVVLVARRTSELERLAEQLRGRHGVDARVFAGDLGDPKPIAALLAETVPLDVGLFIAAAGFGTSGRFIDGALESELAMIDVNCRAVAALTHGFATRMVARRRGGIVLMSSLVAFQGVPRAANYAATKAYVQSLAEGLRAELGPLGVDVLASAPGPVRSGFELRADMKMGMAAGPESVASATLAALGRTGTVRPGWLSKLLEWSLALLPRWGRVRMMAVVMGGMTKHRA
jgi:short-subunit dehydrogenase